MRGFFGVRRGRNDMERDDRLKVENNGSGGKALKAGIGYTVGNILIRGIAFLTIPVFSSLLSTADYGIYNTFASYVSIVTIILGLALQASIKNARFDFPEKLADFCSSLALLTIVNSLVISGVVCCFASPLSRVMDMATPWLVVLIMVESFANCILYFYNAMLSVQYKYKEYLVISFIYSLSSVALSVVLIIFCFKGAPYMGRVLGSVIPLLALSAYMLWRIFRAAKPKVSKQYWKYGLKIALPLVPHQLSQIILSQFDRIMIKSMVGDSAAGLYSFAFNIALLLHVITNSTDTAWSPWFFEQMEAKNYQQIKKSSNLYMLLVTVLSVGLMVISPELVFIMSAGNGEYLPSKYVVIPIVMSMFFSFIYTLPVGVEYYYKKTGYIALGTTLAAVLNVVLNYIFIKMTGSYVAAAYTTVVTHFLYYLFHMILARKIAKRQLFNVGLMAATSLFVLVFGFVCLALADYIIVRAVMLLGILAVLAVFVIKKKDELLAMFGKGRAAHATRD